jgi:hypothetical protein
MQTTVTLDAASYTGYIGNSLTMTCTTNLGVNDFTWRYYPTGDSSQATSIYVSSSYINNSNNRYTVGITQSGQQIITTLTIKSLTAVDSSLTYECSCNILTVCNPSTQVKATATIVSLQPTSNLNLKRLLLNCIAKRREREKKRF